MSANLSPIDKAKFVAAKRAVDYVESGMRVGLGTGSTAAWMVKCLGEMIRDDGLKITGVATSTRTAELAEQVGVVVEMAIGRVVRHARQRRDGAQARYLAVLVRGLERGR